jgi:hypothetical protein
LYLSGRQVVHSVLAASRRISDKYSTDGSIVKLSSLFPGQLRVYYASEYSEMAKIWLSASLYLLRHSHQILVPSWHSVIEIIGSVGCLTL